MVTVVGFGYGKKKACLMNGCGCGKESGGMVRVWVKIAWESMRSIGVCVCVCVCACVCEVIIIEIYSRSKAKHVSKPRETKRECHVD